MVPVSAPKESKKWLTPKMRTWLWGFGFGVVFMALGLTISSAKLGPFFERVGNGIEAIKQDPAPTTVVVP